LSGLESGTDTSGDAATHEADLGGVESGVDLHDGDLCADGVLREGRAAHEVEDLLAILGGETGGAIRHETLALGCANLGAEVGLGRSAVLASLAFGSVGGNNHVTDLNGGNALTNGLNNTSTLVTENARETTFRIQARKGVEVGVAERVVKNLDSNLTSLRRGDDDSFQLQVLLRSPSNSSSTLWKGKITRITVKAQDMAPIMDIVFRKMGRRVLTNRLASSLEFSRHLR